MTRKQQIGFSQRIQFDWLEYTTNLILAGNSRNEIAVTLGERLREQLSVGNDPERGNRDKAITILTKVWVTVPEEFQSLRDQGLELLKRLNRNDRMLVHWCMCMAVYPFFSKVAEATGRLLRLQGTVAAAQVQLRVREQLGERETVSRAARRVMRVFIDWGALLETQNKGIYRGAAKRTVDDFPLGIWVIKAILLARGEKLQSVPGMLRDNHLFPFDIAAPSIRDLEDCKAFEITRHGIDHKVLLSLASTTSTYEGFPHETEQITS